MTVTGGKRVPDRVTCESGIESVAAASPLSSPRLDFDADADEVDGALKAIISPKSQTPKHMDEASVRVHAWGGATHHRDRATAMTVIARRSSGSPLACPMAS